MSRPAATLKPWPPAARPSAPYRCTECGWTTPKWAGRCGECQQWGTVVEAAEQTGILRTVTPDRARPPIAPRSRSRASSTAEAPRRTTGVGEFDRVLGGGIVPGAAILLSGEPGVGKSTLLLEVAAQSARAGRRVLYASAEESTAQVRLRAERTGALHDELYLAAETDLATILGHVDEVRPELLIVDSVQTVSSGAVRGHGRASVAGARGGIHPHPRREGPRPSRHHRRPRHEGRVDRRPAHPRAPRRRRVPVRGRPADLAAVRPGPQEPLRTDGRGRMLRHDRRRHRRGPRPQRPLPRARRPGRRHLRRRSRSRAAAPCRSRCRRSRSRTAAPNPRRIVSGVDAARVAMVLAVLERRADIKVSDLDVYVSTVGGVRWSSRPPTSRSRSPSPAPVRNRRLPRGTAAIGELSLAGEVRPVTQAAQRRSRGRATRAIGRSWMPRPAPSRERSATSAPAGGHPRRRVCRSSESLLPMVDSCGRLLP